MKTFLISITAIICSYFIGNSINQAYRWSKTIDFNNARESQNVNQAFELRLLSSVLFELNKNNVPIAQKYLSEHIKAQNSILKTELKDGYLSDQGRKIISEYLSSKPKGFGVL